MSAADSWNSRDEKNCRVSCLSVLFVIRRFYPRSERRETIGHCFHSKWRDVTRRGGCQGRDGCIVWVRG